MSLRAQPTGTSSIHSRALKNAPDAGATSGWLKLHAWFLREDRRDMMLDKSSDYHLVAYEVDRRFAITGISGKQVIFLKEAAEALWRRPVELNRYLGGKES